MAKERTFYVDRDGRLSETASADTPQSERTPTSAAKRLTERLDRLHRGQRANYEMDVYEVLRDAELGRLSDTRFCPVCRSEMVDIDTLNADEGAIVSCEVCAYRGRLSTFNV